MRVDVVAVHPGSPPMADVLVAGVLVHAEWAGAPPRAGEAVDVELDIDIDGGPGHGPRLPGTVELQDGEILVVRIGEGLVQIEAGGGVFPPGTPIDLPAGRVRVYPTGI